jgi:hypothetical protein
VTNGRKMLLASKAEGLIVDAYYTAPENAPARLPAAMGARLWKLKPSMNWATI